MLKKVYTGKSHSASNGCLKCLINVIMLATSMPH